MYKRRAFLDEKEKFKLQMSLETMFGSENGSLKKGWTLKPTAGNESINLGLQTTLELT